MLDVICEQLVVPATTHPVWIGAADWSKWYRQLPKPRSEWWFQIVGIDPGFRIDYAMIFGDAAAPDGANRAEDIFLVQRWMRAAVPPVPSQANVRSRR
eukprot:COSAG05_NODE_1813_length_4036_cov_463.816358_1_plen_98_part_00